MRIPEPDPALLSRLLPGDAPEDLTVRQGQFHQVVIGSERVVCLARTEAAAERLPHRAAGLRLLDGFGLSFRTPRPLLASHDPPFLVLSRVPGAPLEARALEDPQVAGAAAAQHVALLRELARASEKARSALPAPWDRWRRFAAGVRTELFGLMSDDGRRRAERELAALDGLPHVTDAVVHGDLGAENVLWEWADGLPVLGGVIDWDEVTIGDPAEDLAAIGASFGTPFLDRVLTLGGWDRTMAARIAVIRSTFALQQALSAHRDGDEEQLADGLTGYR
ncbi:aminoglycoside phosphotransferase family protein [Nonomuraea sp. NPDC050404]|uniref:phosphotransferase family protein n=1 Tax=Nonomuraea sp. NPDC050404 TaxID=3155783 RepID=UPI0033CB7E0B